MQFYNAKVIDILRSSQRDEAFTNELENDFIELLKLFGSRQHNQFYKYTPIIARSWYYFMTSLGNLQTLGEEYAGVLRISGNKVPNKMLQLLWLVLFVGGDIIYDKILNQLKITINESPTIQKDAKDKLQVYINFFKEKKHIIIRLHQSIFYIFGSYYYFSNRFTGIKYVLLRQWMQDDSSTNSFKFLGKMTIIYVLFYIIHEFFTFKMPQETENIVVSESSKGCILCGENRKNTSVTPCGHLFCWECIHDSLKYQPNCPLCREIVDSSRIVLLQNFL